MQVFEKATGMAAMVFIMELTQPIWPKVRCLGGNMI